MKPQVIVCVFNNLATDQRVEKVCETLYREGYPILLVGCDWKGLPNMERPYPFERLSLKSTSLKTAYAEFQYKLYGFLKAKAGERSIILANDLDLLYACFKFTKKRNLPLVYDSHEIFTEMPYIQGRFTQKIWRYLENKVIREIPYMMTESESYAKWFQDKYGIGKPVVIGNFPRRQDAFVKDDKTDSAEKIVIYQGAVNPFRGLDKAILAMKLLPNHQLWVYGDGPNKTIYENFAKENEIANVTFFGNVPPAELRKATVKADVGISLEENAGLSYYLSLPNKVSDYIQARIPIVGSDFPETGRVIKSFGLGEVIQNWEPSHIATKIEDVLSRPKDYYVDNLEKASKELCWEVQEQEIADLFSKVCNDYKFS